MTLSNMNNNLYYNPIGSNGFGWNGSYSSSFTTWKSNCSCDSSGSLTADAKLNSDGTLQSGSPAIGFGADLTSLGISLLDSDKNSIARPSGSPWDAGAYQYQAPPNGSSTAGPVTRKGPVTSK